MSPRWNHAIVVGASSGIGMAIARELVAGGCKVALVARRESELKTLAAELNGRSIGSLVALVYPHDVTHYDEVPSLFQQICHDLSGLDVIIYASGVMPEYAPDEYNFAKDKHQIEVNLLGAMAWINEAAERFGRGATGTIIGISSVAGDRGRGGMIGYATSKAAFNAYLEAIRNRVGRLGVSVITVKPGPVNTPMTELLDRSKKPLLIEADKAAELIIDGAKRRRNVVYVPWMWRPIMTIICSVPSYLFQRLKNLNS